MNKRYQPFKIYEQKCMYRRDVAISEFERIVSILIKYNVKRVFVFGSLLNNKKFNLCSDIDFVVEGLEMNKYLDAYGEVYMSSMFEVDLIPIERMSERLRNKVFRIGKILYEKQ